MENKIRLTLMGLSYNPMQDGAFAMLLSAEGSNKRLPIIIGAAEAQAIAIIIEKIKPRRPMTHDLFATMTHAFGIELKEVFIYNYEDGIFSAEMTFSDGERQITLDSRSSDAVAVAIRVGAPIYTTPAILDEAGIEMVEVDESSLEASDDAADLSGNAGDADLQDERPDYASMTDEELETEFEKAMARDDFEEAAVIRSVLDGRQGTA